jgi:glycosyltransferase involved in cell wall biosynthesis
MKILILSEFIENYREVASFKIRYLTALKFSERGHDVFFMSPSRKFFNTVRRSENKRFKIITTPGLLPLRLRTGGFSLLDALFKSKTVLSHDFDIIQVTNGHRPAQLMPSLLGKYLKKAVIIDECWEWFGKGGYADKRKNIVGKVISFYDKNFELLFKKFYDHIITISSALRDRFKTKDNITVLNGATENGVLRDYLISEAREKLNVDPDAFIIGMSNVCLADNEDNSVFFKAFERLCQQYSNCYLLVTGSDKKYIEEIGKTYLFSKNIIFPGWVEFDTYNKYMSCCDLFVLPFRNTAINRGRWPNKIGDYLCLNRPVITNPTGDIKLLFDQYKVGILCDQTPEGFFHVINKIFNESINLESYAVDSLYVANEVLSFNKRIDKYLEIFEKERKTAAFIAL